MVVSGVEKQYKEYLKQKNSRWEFGNSILYQMCEDNPLHNDADVVIGKIWLIGRSYAAAIERRKNADDYQGDDFYYDAVAPKMLEIGKELDSRIESLKNNTGIIADCVPEILSTHKYLMDAFMDLTGLEKRSLASKYLHFHCPEKFFIYDSRARAAIGKIVKRPNKKILLGIDDHDAEYGDFVCRMLELQEYLDEKLGVYEKPRAIDSFLLSEVK
jgi:hypothetical protein